MTTLILKLTEPEKIYENCEEIANFKPTDFNECKYSTITYILLKK
jgi:hypothetical protein